MVFVSGCSIKSKLLLKMKIKKVFFRLTILLMPRYISLNVCAIFLLCSQVLQTATASYILIKIEEAGKPINQQFLLLF